MNIFKTSIAVAALTLVAGGAQALAIPFSWNGGSLNADGALALASYSPTSGSAGSIAVGDTVGGLNFGTVSLLGGGSGTLEIGVNFVDPNPSGQSVSGPYSVLSLGFISGGTWSGGSTDFGYSFGGYTGTARLTMDAIDTGLQFGPSFTFTGSITNLSQELASLPEPGTLAMVLFGLAAFGFAGRRKA